MEQLYITSANKEIYIGKSLITLFDGKMTQFCGTVTNPILTSHTIKYLDETDSYFYEMNKLYKYYYIIENISCFDTENALLSLYNLLALISSVLFIFRTTK